MTPLATGAVSVRRGLWWMHAATLPLTALAASVPVTLELRNYVVDYLRPTVCPRQAPYDVPEEARMAAMLANDTFPGPCIEAKEGDSIEVTVVNKLLGQQVTFVWEGAEVQQAPAHPIPQQGGTFTYRLLAAKPGTFWWHASIPSQAAAGLKGALVVHSTSEPLAPAYQEERLLVLADALQRPEICVAPGGGVANGCVELDQLTVNGQYGDGSKRLPLPVIDVEQGRCYRFRCLAMLAAQGGRIEASFDGHRVRVVGPSGPGEPVISFDISAGSSVDVVLCADQHPGPFGKDYAITLNYSGRTVTKSFAGVLRYAAAASAETVPREPPAVHV